MDIGLHSKCIMETPRDGLDMSMEDSLFIIEGKILCK